MTFKEPQNKKLILIIDDDQSYREILKIKFENAGYEIIEASNGEEGLKILNTYKPNLILLDLVMPKMNGIDTLFYLKAHPIGKNIKTIMMTNKVDIKEELGQQYEKIIKKFGALDFISKTQDLNYILTKIEKTINEK